VTAQNVTPQTVVRVDGAPLPTRVVRQDQVLARVAPGLLRDGSVRVELSDGMRQSNALSLSVRRPSLTRLYPSSTAAGRAFSMRADGSSLLTLDSLGAGPGTRVTFDDAPLVAAASSERWLTAVVPPELIARPGQHTVKLRNAFGDSNALAFEVTAPAPLDPFGGPPVEAPPVSGPLPGPLALEAISPAKTRVGHGFNVQPGGHSRRWR
jgi:hypothetical protein